MSSSPSSTSPAPSTNERLDVPVLPPSSSRFVLPPPPSDLLNRLQAFLPRIKNANEQLEQGGEQREVEEAVVMEELSSDSSDSSDESESEEESSDDEEEKEENGQGEEEEGRMERLMDIGQRPKVTKKKLVVMEEDFEGAKEQGGDEK